MSAYWSEVSAKRKARGTRPLATLTDDDFVNVQPPNVPRRDRVGFAALAAPIEPIKLKGRAGLPLVADFIAAAKSKGYKLDVLPNDAPADKVAAFEDAFKDRYALVALRAGLTKEQNLGVFALETGGDGTYDNEAGIANGKRVGHAISTAIGYAQLLSANSVDVIATYGEDIAKALDAENKHDKAALVRRMQSDVLAVHKRIPTWSEAGRIASARLGMAVQAANLDLDIGPYLQITKLRDIDALYKTFAKKNNMPTDVPESAEVMESMNLAGPVSGFAMSHPLTAKRLTVNFFERGGYERNSVVRVSVDGVKQARTAESLQARMHEIMNGEATKHPGYLALGRAFDKAQQQLHPAQ